MAATDPYSYGILSVPDVARYYGFPAELTGRGQRIAILEFYGGYHEDDIAQFFAELGVPAPSVEAVPITDHHGLPLTGHNSPQDLATLSAVIADYREPTSTIDDLEAKYGDVTVRNVQATLECTMDIAIAGGIAPGAEIRLYFAPQTGGGWVAAIDEALAWNPTAISCSWGAAEPDGWQPSQITDIDAALARARDAGVTVCCSSGDSGAQNSVAVDAANVHFPASSPHVLACGGTRMTMSNGRITGEETWNEDFKGLARASGGGMSGLFERPDFQAGIPTPPPTPGIWTGPDAGDGFVGRWIPDVSANADYRSGYRIILGGEPFVAHETSASAPLWAGLIALLAEGLGGSVGWLPELLYRPELSGCFNDIVEGDNRCTGSTARAFEAGPGWDACTGLGSPRGRELLDALRLVMT